MDNLTASEVAGFGVGTLLLCATIAAPKVDAFISASQRSSLGMCKRCGDLRMIACGRCKGQGTVKKGGLFGFGMLGDILRPIGDVDTAAVLGDVQNVNQRGAYLVLIADLFLRVPCFVFDNIVPVL